MKILCVVGAALLVGAMARAACAADKPDAKDAKAVQTCMGGKGARNAEVCIGVVATPCIGPDEGAKRDREIEDCLGREKLVWDQILNDSYRAMRDGLDDDQRVKLQEMQRAWIAMRDASCHFYYDFFQGLMANPMIANCDNRETARRAIFLKGFADDMAGWVKNKRQ
jgi:uncharacterized protein YecT (DUF1311 family)